MHRQSTSTLMWLVAVACAATGATLKLDDMLKAKLAAQSSESCGAAYVYRVASEAFSRARLDTAASITGLSKAAVFVKERRRYVEVADGVRKSVLFDGNNGRYLCYCEDRREMDAERPFPPDLNARARGLLQRLLGHDCQYVQARMSVYALKEPGGAPAHVYRRTYEVRRLVHGQVVLEPEGTACIQFNREGAVTLAIVPAVRLTQQPMAEPIEPMWLERRLVMRTAAEDTVVVGGSSMIVDTVVALAMSRSLRKEERNGVDYLVPHQSVLVDYCSGQREPVRREMHFTLDPDSRGYVPCDPWLEQQ